jgi:hypothetical protein
MGTTGTRLRAGNLRTVFVELLEQAGERPRRTLSRRKDGNIPGVAEGKAARSKCEMTG